MSCKKANSRIPETINWH